MGVILRVAQVPDHDRSRLTLNTEMEGQASLRKACRRLQG